MSEPVEPTPLPAAFTWRGITLERVYHRERTGGSAYDFFGVNERSVERPSKPAQYSGTVGIWRYSLELQADQTWLGRIYIGGASNTTSSPNKDWRLALDFAAEWWAAAVGAIPEQPAE